MATARDMTDGAEPGALEDPAGRAGPWRREVGVALDPFRDDL
jgi:hypothetical protein